MLGAAKESNAPIPRTKRGSTKNMAMLKIIVALIAVIVGAKLSGPIQPLEEIEDDHAYDPDGAEEQEETGAEEQVWDGRGGTGDEVWN
jgi:hypothetical protein